MYKELYSILIVYFSKLPEGIRHPVLLHVFEKSHSKVFVVM